ncbi:uncharacterized protein LOC141884536 [Acropora palmata]|uniref:uncharacterized protein LOC141884536 n=1 Tax=Acropora palmata TaxID=6131 RepID=UPI003DA0F68F
MIIAVMNTLTWLAAPQKLVRWQWPVHHAKKRLKIVELSARVKAIARENELDKAPEAVLVKAQAGCVRQHANVELVRSLVRTRNLWQYQAQQPKKKVPAASAKTKEIRHTQ